MMAGDRAQTAKRFYEYPVSRNLPTLTVVPPPVKPSYHRVRADKLLSHHVVKWIDTGKPLSRQRLNVNGTNVCLGP
jgi:hypothetical protein